MVWLWTLLSIYFPHQLLTVLDGQVWPLSAKQKDCLMPHFWIMPKDYKHHVKKSCAIFASLFFYCKWHTVGVIRLINLATFGKLQPVALHILFLLATYYHSRSQVSFLPLIYYEETLGYWNCYCLACLLQLYPPSHPSPFPMESLLSHLNILTSSHRLDIQDIKLFSYCLFNS